MDGAFGLVTVGFEPKGVFFPASGGAAVADPPFVPEDLGVEEALAPGGNAVNGLALGFLFDRDGADFSEEPDCDGTADFGARVEIEGAAFGVALGRKDEPLPLAGGRTKVDRLELLDRPKLLPEDELDRGLL